MGQNTISPTTKNTIVSPMNVMYPFFSSSPTRPKFEYQSRTYALTINNSQEKYPQSKQPDIELPRTNNGHRNVTKAGE